MFFLQLLTSRNPDDLASGVFTKINNVLLHEPK